MRAGRTIRWRWLLLLGMAVSACAPNVDKAHQEVLMLPLLTSQSNANDVSIATSAQASSNLKIIFTGIGRTYLSDVSVSIYHGDSHAPLVKQSVCFPLFLAKLPAGEYQIDVTVDNFITSQSVTLTDGVMNNQIIDFPIYGHPNHRWQSAHTHETPLHELLDAFDFGSNTVEQRCS